MQVSSVDQYVEIMDNLKLSNPQMMNVAVSANLRGLTLDKIIDFISKKKQWLYIVFKND